MVYGSSSFILARELGYRLPSLRLRKIDFVDISESFQLSPRGLWLGVTLVSSSLLGTLPNKNMDTEAMMKLVSASEVDHKLIRGLPS